MPAVRRRLPQLLLVLVAPLAVLPVVVLPVVDVPLAVLLIVVVVISYSPSLVRLSQPRVSAAPLAA
jgi:hypothetical protein